MAHRATPRLSRDNPDHAPLAGNIKVTREDWLTMARDVLVHEGVGAVKIQTLGRRMGVSRSSFYWYFKDRADLLHALLAEWEARNTRSIVDHCTLPAATINHGACNFFRCFVAPHLFDRRLDFAVRDWARRDEGVNTRMEAADAQRLEAVTAMFARHGYGPEDADARARILYFMQIGYHAVELGETMELRMSRLAPFLLGFTGVAPSAALIEEFAAFAYTQSEAAPS